MAKINGPTLTPREKFELGVDADELAAAPADIHDLSICGDITTLSARG
jgi:hypothetical protein